MPSSRVGLCSPITAASPRRQQRWRASSATWFLRSACPARTTPTRAATTTRSHCSARPRAACRSTASLRVLRPSWPSCGAKGKKPYFIPGGGSNAIGSLGYVKAALSIVEASRAADKPFDAIVCCSGSGGTHSGMLAGLRAAGDNTPVYGVSVRFDSDRQGENIHKQFVACAALFEAEAPKSDVVIVDSYVGPGYSLPTDEMREAIELFAKKEGIFLDPVYTGKGAAGLIGLAREGTLKPGAKVLFLHTGGAPSLFHYMPLPGEE